MLQRFIQDNIKDFEFAELLKIFGYFVRLGDKDRYTELFYAYICSQNKFINVMPENTIFIVNFY